MDAASSALVFRLIVTGTHSLLQYVSESFPWSADRAHAALDAIKLIAREERDEVARLTRILQKKHMSIRSSGSYPSHFTTTNFVGVDYLVPKLIVEHEKEIADVERQLHPINDDEVRGLAENYLGMKRRHLDALRALAPK